MLIRELPAAVAGRVRSGENGCSSVPQAVAELLANALDAGAHNVVIRLNAEELAFTVEDDGHGLSAADLQHFGRRYHTSKLSSVADLQAGVSTLGFRGEATSSICSTAHVRLTTRARGSFETLTKTLRGSSSGVVASHVGPSSLPLTRAGTIVEVTQFLFNQPVRRKQATQQPRETEAQTLRAVLRMALPHSNVAVTLARLPSGRVLLQLPQGRDCGTSFLGVVPGQPPSLPLFSIGTDNGLRVQGALGSLACSYPHQEHQYLYVNRRHVHHKQLAALLNARFVRARLRALARLQSAGDEDATQELLALQQEQQQGGAPGGNAALSKCHPAFLVMLTCPLSSYEVITEPDKSNVVFRDLAPLLELVGRLADSAWALPGDMPSRPGANSSQDSGYREGVQGRGGVDGGNSQQPARQGRAATSLVPLETTGAREVNAASVPDKQLTAAAANCIGSSASGVIPSVASGQGGRQGGAAGGSRAAGTRRKRLSDPALPLPEDSALGMEHEHDQAPAVIQGSASGGQEQQGGLLTGLLQLQAAASSGLCAGQSRSMSIAAVVPVSPELLVRGPAGAVVAAAAQSAAAVVAAVTRGAAHAQVQGARTAYGGAYTLEPATHSGVEEEEPGGHLGSGPWEGASGGSHTRVTGRAPYKDALLVAGDDQQVDSSPLSFPQHAFVSARHAGGHMLPSLLCRPAVYDDVGMMDDEMHADPDQQEPSPSPPLRRVGRPLPVLSPLEPLRMEEGGTPGLSDATPSGYDSIGTGSELLDGDSDGFRPPRQRFDDASPIGLVLPSPFGPRRDSFGQSSPAWDVLAVSPAGGEEGGGPAIGRNGLLAPRQEDDGPSGIRTDCDVHRHSPRLLEGRSFSFPKVAGQVSGHGASPPSADDRCAAVSLLRSHSPIGHRELGRWGTVAWRSWASGHEDDSPGDDSPEAYDQDTSPAGQSPSPGAHPSPGRLHAGFAFRHEAAAGCSGEETDRERASMGLSPKGFPPSDQEWSSPDEPPGYGWSRGEASPVLDLGLGGAATQAPVRRPQDGCPAGAPGDLGGRHGGVSGTEDEVEERHGEQVSVPLDSTCEDGLSCAASATGGGPGKGTEPTDARAASTVAAAASSRAGDFGGLLSVLRDTPRVGGLAGNPAAAATAAGARPGLPRQCGLLLPIGSKRQAAPVLACGSSVPPAQRTSRDAIPVAATAEGPGSAAAATAPMPGAAEPEPVGAAAAGADPRCPNANTEPTPAAGGGAPIAPQAQPPPLPAQQPVIVGMPLHQQPSAALLPPPQDSVSPSDAGVPVRHLSFAGCNRTPPIHSTAAGTSLGDSAVASSKSVPAAPSEDWGSASGRTQLSEEDRHQLGRLPLLRLPSDAARLVHSAPPHPRKRGRSVHGNPNSSLATALGSLQSLGAPSCREGPLAHLSGAQPRDPSPGTAADMELETTSGAPWPSLPTQRTALTRSSAAALNTTAVVAARASTAPPKTARTGPALPPSSPSILAYAPKCGQQQGQEQQQQPPLGDHSTATGTDEKEGTASGSSRQAPALLPTASGSLSTRPRKTSLAKPSGGARDQRPAKRVRFQLPEEEPPSAPAVTHQQVTALAEDATPTQGCAGVSTATAAGPLKRTSPPATLEPTPPAAHSSEPGTSPGLEQAADTLTASPDTEMAQAPAASVPWPPALSQLAPKQHTSPDTSPDSQLVGGPRSGSVPWPPALSQLAPHQHMFSQEPDSQPTTQDITAVPTASLQARQQPTGTDVPPPVGQAVVPQAAVAPRDHLDPLFRAYGIGGGVGRGGGDGGGGGAGGAGPLLCLDDLQRLVAPGQQLVPGDVTRDALGKAAAMAQVGRKFIPLLSRDGTLLVVDQHAAHERVRLEHLTHLLLRKGAATAAAAAAGASSSTVASGSGAGALPNTERLPGEPGAVPGKAGGRGEERAGTGAGTWAAHAAGQEVAAAGVAGVGLGDTAAALGRQAVHPPLQGALAAHEAAALHRHREAVAGWGWVVREEERSGGEGALGAGVAAGVGGVTWGGSSVVVLAVPTVLGVALSGASELKAYLQQLCDTGGASLLPPGVLRVLRSKACRTAIMFGDTLDQQQCATLLQKLRATRLWTQCAHGRPTVAPLVHLPTLRGVLQRRRKALSPWVAGGDGGGGRGGGQGGAGAVGKRLGAKRLSVGVLRGAIDRAASAKQQAGS